MRALRRLVPGWTLFIALGTLAGGSSAQLLVVTADGEPAANVHAELAYAEGDGPAVTWLALRFGPAPVAVVAALPEAARAEPALDAWFMALERSGSVNILPPQRAASCVEAPGYVHVVWPRAGGAPGNELDLRTSEDVVTALEEQGLPTPAAGSLPEAEHYAVWSWTPVDSEETTRTLRIVGASAPLRLLPGAGFPVLVTAITRGPKQRRDERPSDELSVGFLGGPTSNYQDRLRDWLGYDERPLLEARSRGLLFDWSILSNAVSLPPLAESYARAASRELPVDADDCAKQLAQLRHADAPSSTACGDARDFELALLASGREQATLQRWVSSGAHGFSPDQLQPGGEGRSPLLHAREGAACVEDPPPAAVIDPPAAGIGAASGSTTVVVEETVVVETTTTSDVSCGSSPGRDPYYDDRDTPSCSSDTSSNSGNDDTCTGDSSSSSNDDACSGDSSSSSNDDACSGDSSSSSNDDACSGDSSSSSNDDGCASDSSGANEDSGCDGGSEQQGYDGDTCTASSAPGAARSSQELETARKARPRRVKLSLWSIALVALALPIRRRKRRKI